MRARTRTRTHPPTRGRVTDTNNIHNDTLLSGFLFIFTDGCPQSRKLEVICQYKGQVIASFVSIGQQSGSLVRCRFLAARWCCHLAGRPRINQIPDTLDPGRCDVSSSIKFVYFSDFVQFHLLEPATGVE